MSSIVAKGYEYRKGGCLCMDIDKSVFAYKLYEMEEQYGKLQCRIRICEQGDRQKIHSELEKAEDEYKENTLLLEKKARACRSPAVTRLTQAQIDYRRKIGDTMKKQVIKDLHSEESTPEQDEREADMLYAEFAMDFALTALDRQESAEDTEDSEEKDKEDTGCKK